MIGIQKLKMRGTFSFVQNLDVTDIVSSYMNWTISQIQESLTKNSMISMDNITPTTLIDPHLHSLGQAWTDGEPFYCFLREYKICWWLHLIITKQFVHSIQFFRNITKHAQDTVVMSQISETYQTMQSTLKSVMQELQSNRHHLNYSAMLSSPIFIMNGSHLFPM